MEEQEHQTIAVVKLNRGAWMDFRDQLIQKFTAEGTYITHSDEFVKTTTTTYVVKLITVNPNFLDPLLGFEGKCDASDLVRFMDSIMAKLEQYTTMTVNPNADAAETTGTVATPPEEVPTTNPENPADAPGSAPEETATTDGGADANTNTDIPETLDNTLNNPSNEAIPDQKGPTADAPEASQTNDNLSADQSTAPAANVEK